MPNDATQEGVSANAADAAKQTEQKLHPREEAMRRIMSSRLEQLSTESGIEVKSSLEGDADTDPADAEAEAARAALAAGEESQLEVQTAAEPADPGKAKVKVKVDGVESEVSVEDMVRTYQKNATADRRLEEANRRQRELDEREAQLAAQQAAVTTAKADPAAPLVDPTVAKQFTAALFDGDEEKAVAGFNAAVQQAIDKAMAGRTDGATPVDADQIAEQVEQRFAVNSALKQSQTDYPDMYADPDIEALAAVKIRRMRAEGIDFVAALEATQGELAAKFGWKKSGRQEAPASTTRDEKQNRKAALDPVVGANVKASTTEVPPMSPSQVIAQMAKNRPGYGGG